MTVRIYPHGKPEQIAIALVKVYVAPDATPGFLVLVFDSPPPFALTGTSPQRLSMYLMKYNIGPYVEIRGGGHYEVE